MFDLKIYSTSQNKVTDGVFIHLKNSLHEMIFACDKSVLLNFFKVPAPQNKDQSHSSKDPSKDQSKDQNKAHSQFFRTLAYCFSFEFIKQFHKKCPGGLFYVAEVFYDENDIHDTAAQPQINSDISFFDDTAAAYEAVLYTSKELQHELYKTFNGTEQKAIIEKYIDFPPIKKVIPLFAQKQKHLVTLSNHLMRIEHPKSFLKCVVNIANQAIPFYFDQNSVSYFCQHLIQIRDKSPQSLMRLSAIFSSLFVSFLTDELGETITLLTQGVVRVVDTDLAQITIDALSNSNSNSNSKNNNKTNQSNNRNESNNGNQGNKAEKLTVFIEPRHSEFLFTLLTDLDFVDAPVSRSAESAAFLDALPEDAHFPFPVEIGVTYCKVDDLKNIEEGDIILFDKQYISSNQEKSIKGIVNLNGVFLKTQIEKDTCRVTGFLSDW